MTTIERNDAIRKQLHEILDIVIDGNGLRGRTRGATGILPTLFMSFSGHIGQVDVQLHKHGWSAGVSWDRQWVFQTYNLIDDGKIEGMRKTITDALNDKSEAEVLEDDILRAEEAIARDQRVLKNMKRRLRRMREDEGK